MTTGNLLEQTVLDLCDDTYYDKLGFKAYELLEHEGGPRVCTIACVNPLLNDNQKTHEFLLEDYACFMVSPFKSEQTVQSIFDMSYALGRPVMGKVDCYGDQCLIIATNQQPWADWFASIFLDGSGELYAQLQPIVTKALIEISQGRK